MLDCYNQGRHEIVNIVQTLANNSRIYEIGLFMKIVKEDNRKSIQKIIDYANFNQWQNVSREINLNSSNNSFADIEEDDLFLNAVLTRTSQAGLTMEQAQAVNKNAIDSKIAIQEEKTKKLNIAKIELAKKREENNEALRFAKERQALVGSNISFGGLPITDGNNFDNKVNYSDLEKYVITEWNMVRIPNGDDYDIYYWDEKTGRYVRYSSKKNMCTTMTSSAYKIYGNMAEISNSQIDAMVNRMYYNSVPLLGDENALVKIPKETFVFSETVIMIWKNKYLFPVKSKPTFILPVYLVIFTNLI